MNRSSNIRVLALCLAPLGRTPSQRFRIEQWAPHLQRLGVRIDFESFMSPELDEVLYRKGMYAEKSTRLIGAMLNRARSLRHVQEFDVVYVLRETALLGPAMFERWIKLKRVPFIVDFDDAVFLSNSSESNKVFGWLKCPGKASTACRLAAHVMVCNDYLADYARPFNPQVTVVPITMDTEIHKPPHPAWESSKPQFVWTGSPTTAPYLESLSNALQRLRKRHDFRLRVIGAPQVSLPGIDVELLPWKPETEVLNLYGSWGGLMPVPDNPWTRGKGGNKGLQYMAVGVPLVCSPTGMGSHLVRNGENGFLASSEDEWVEKLSLLITSAELRQRLGREGRKTVEAWYSAEVQVPRVYEIFRDAAFIGEQ